MAVRTLFMKIVENEKDEAMLDNTRRDVLLGHFVVLNAPGFQQIPS